MLLSCTDSARLIHAADNIICQHHLIAQCSPLWQCPSAAILQLSCHSCGPDHCCLAWLYCLICACQRQLRSCDAIRKFLTIGVGHGCTVQSCACQRQARSFHAIHMAHTIGMQHSCTVDVAHARGNHAAFTPLECGMAVPSMLRRASTACCSLHSLEEGAVLERGLRGGLIMPSRTGVTIRTWPTK